MASNVSAVSGRVANGHQTLASRFHKPPYDPGRRVFPSPALALAFLRGPSRYVAKLKCWHTYTPPPPVRPRTRPCHATSTGKTSRGCSHFVMFRLPRLLDPQVAPTAAFQLGGRAVYTTHHSVGCLPRVVVSLRIRIGQLIRLDSHQLDYSLVGCSVGHVYMFL